MVMRLLRLSSTVEGATAVPSGIKQGSSFCRVPYDGACPLSVPAHWHASHRYQVMAPAKVQAWDCNCKPTFSYSQASTSTSGI